MMLCFLFVVGLQLSGVNPNQMDIKVAKERVSIEKIEKVFDILVNGKKITIVKWRFYEEVGVLDDGWTILSIEAYGELEDDEQSAVSDFVDNLKL